MLLTPRGSTWHSEIAPVLSVNPLQLGFLLLTAPAVVYRDPAGAPVHGAHVLSAVEPYGHVVRYCPTGHAVLHVEQVAPLRYVPASHGHLVLSGPKHMERTSSFSVPLAQIGL